MAKQKAEPIVEEAEIIQDLITIEPSDDTLVFVKRIGDVLPVKFPEKFITPDYGEHSKADADEKKKKLDLAIKAIKGHDDVAGYEKVKELANVFQKGATRLDAATKEYVKPFDNVTKSFKQTSKTVQEYYREYEQIAREKYKEYTDWEEEQARKKEEERQARATARRKSLFDIGGVTDPTTGNWTFPYSGETVPDIAILDFDDIDWQAKYDRIQAEYQDHLVREEEKRKAEEAAQSAKDAELEAAKTIIVKMRSKELKFEGWEFDEGLQSYTKNGHAIHVLGVRDYSDEQWDEAIEAANQPQEEKAVEAEIKPVETPKAQAPVWDEEETEEAPVEAVSVDPVAAALNIDSVKEVVSIIGETINIPSAEIRTAEDAGVVIKALRFTKEEPYIDILLNKTFLRIYPVELDEEANADISKDRIKSVKEHGDLRLAIVSL